MIEENKNNSLRMRKSLRDAFLWSKFHSMSTIKSRKKSLSKSIEVSKVLNKYFTTISQKSQRLLRREIKIQ